MSSSPIAQNDFLSTSEFTGDITIDVLANDSDPDGDALTLLAATMSSGSGFVSVNADNTLNYSAGSFGQDVISYTVQDTFGNTAQANVFVDIFGGGGGGGGGNSAPITQEDSALTDEFTPVTVDVLANDFDPDSDTLTVTNAFVSAGDGMVVVNADSSLSFTPNGAGDAIVTYTAMDSFGNTSDSTLTVTVSLTGGGNTPPVANNDMAITSMGTPVTVSVLENDSDADGDTLVLNSIAVVSGLGSVDVNADNTVIFTPDQGFVGDAVIDYTIEDSSRATADASLIVVVEGQVVGDALDNYLFGSSGNDLIAGLDGNDHILGDDVSAGGVGGFYEDGNDVLIGGLGNDSLIGASGNDTYLFNLGDGQDVINNFDPLQYATGTPSFDRLVFGVGINPANIKITQGAFSYAGIDAPSLIITINDTNDSITIMGGGPTGEVPSLEEVMLGAIEFADGSVWDKSVIFSQVSTAIMGDEFDNSLSGSNSNDVVQGLAGNDFLLGNDGDDVLDGGTGNDTIDGGDGNDTYIFNLGDGQDKIRNFDYNQFYNGINSIDKLVFGSGVNPSDIELRADYNSNTALVIAIKGTTDTITIHDYFAGDLYQLDSFEFADGTVWDKGMIASMPIMVVGDDNSNPLLGSLSHDVMLGLGGDDYLDGNEGTDLLDGGTGNDILSGGNGNDTLKGGQGDDTLGAYNTYDGGDYGDDVLEGGFGNDSLAGGSGNDTYVFNLSDGQDFINNFDSNEYYNGIISTDKLVFGVGILSTDIVFSYDTLISSNLVIGIKNTSDTITVVGYFDNMAAHQLDAIEFADGTVWTAAQVFDLLNDAPQLTGTPIILANGLEDTAYTIYTSDLLQGFTDADGDTLGVINLNMVGSTGVSNFDLLDNQDGTYTFTPSLNFNGTVSFSYQVIDGRGGVVDAVQSFMLDAVNDAPRFVVMPPALENALEDVTYTIYASQLLDGSTDDDGDTGSVNSLQITDGSLIDNQNGTYSFTPNHNFNGNATLSYQVIDGHGGSVGMVLDLHIDAVNDEPIFSGTPTTLANATEDTAYIIQVADLLQGFTDADGDILSINNLYFSNGFNNSGWLDNQNGSYTFTSDANFSGTIYLNYQVTDGYGGIVDATQSFVVDAVNDAIEGFGFPIPIDMAEDSTLTIDSNYLLSGFSDADGDLLIASNLQVTHGNLMSNPDGTYSLTFAQDFYGSTNLLYQVSDGHGSVVEASLLFDINPVNDAPILGAEISTQHASAGQAFHFTLANDAFIDVDSTLNYSAMLQYGSDLPSWLHFDAATKTFSGTPSSSDVMSLTLAVNVVASDGEYYAEQTFDLVLEDVNHAPTGAATAILANGTNGVTYIIQSNSLLQGFTDADGDTLSTLNLSADHASVQNNGNGTYSLTPAVGYSGLVQLSYQVVDSRGGILSANQSFTLSAITDTMGTIGADILQGDAGDNTYVVNHVRDVIIESANAGIDTIESSISYTLRDNLENLTLTGTKNLSGTGNAADNVLTGNEGNNRLLAGAGNDTLYGLAGGDTLNGGADADIMYGGLGNDTFTVESVGDIVNEFVNEGFDTVNSFVSYTLTANVERLILEGSDDLNGFGNDLNNTLNGNNANNYLVGGAGDDTLQGKGGADTLEGGLGNDLYYADNVGDVVTEVAAQGTDKVSSSISYTLTVNVEQLFLTGIAGLTGIGNSLNNIIYGNDGNNQLFGDAGNDSLNGGAGNDLLDGGFGLDTLVGGAGNDTYILGINSGRDIINNNDATGNDKLLFDAGINADQVWLRQLGNDLEVSIMGTANSVKVQNWYSNTANQLDSLQLADGKTLLANEVQTLVEAMAAFATPALGQTSLTTAQHTALDSVIVASW